MARLLVLLAEGFEEIEALTPVDLLRRAGADVDVVSISDSMEVNGAHAICVHANRLLRDLDVNDALDMYDAVVLPGGAPGYVHLKESILVKQLCEAFVDAKKVVAAICAAPTVLADFGLLEDKSATCYPGMEEALINGGALFVKEPYVWDCAILTSRGMGTAMDFGLELVERFYGSDAATALAGAVVYGNS